VSARRFGGAHSPGGPGATGPSATGPTAPGPAAPRSAWADRRIGRRPLRARLLYLFPTPLLLGALGAVPDDPTGMVWMGAAWGALILAARLTLDGVEAQAAYEARAVAKPPAFPRKLFAAAITGAAVAASAWFGALGLAGAAILGAAAAGLHVAAFGPDPLRAKGVNGLDGEALDEAVARLETARALIADMTAAAGRLGDRALAARVGRLAASAEETVARLERDPGDLRMARRFLAVYLVGARDATVKAAQTDIARDAEARAGFESLLNDLETHFAAHRDRLSEGDRAALDVEIAVLRDRLRLEGV
jgi:hypothetical protein